MLENITHWALKLPSLLSQLNSMHFLKFSTSNNKYINSTTFWKKEARNYNIYFNYVILALTLLYITYKTYFHSVLRRQNFNILQRNRIINSLWSWGFHSVFLYYLLVYSSSDVPLSSLQELAPLHPSSLLFKSFYLHYAGVKVFCCNAWLNGWTHLLFTLFAFNSFTDWSYTYTLFVSNSILSTNKNIYFPQTLYRWIWFISECLDSVWLNIFKYRKSNSWLRAYLFSPASEESIQLISIYNKNRDFHKKRYINPRVQRRAELWKTLLCAVSVKRKLKRMRKVE